MIRIEIERLETEICSIVPYLTSASCVKRDMWPYLFELHKCSLFCLRTIILLTFCLKTPQLSNVIKY